MNGYEDKMSTVQERNFSIRIKFAFYSLAGTYTADVRLRLTYHLCGDKIHNIFSYKLSHWQA